MIRVLIADDEERWRRLIGDFLRNEDYDVLEASDGLQAVEMVRREGPLDLVILDIMMPNLDGIEACRIIRGISNVPIMMVTARSDEESELQGFNCGADDYISKPLRFPVFMARIHALLKRSGSVRDTLTVADMCIDPVARTVLVGGEEIILTPREFELLLYLAQNLNTALSRQQILDAVWNYDYYGDARTVDTHVKNLRMKLGAPGLAIKTIRGLGYKLEG